MMFQEFRKEIDWGGRKLTLETGKVARQADGAVTFSSVKAAPAKRKFSPRA